jgi:hypothetical protein
LEAACECYFVEFVRQRLGVSWMVICFGKGVTVGQVWAFGVSGIAEDAAGHVALGVFGDFGHVWFIVGRDIVGGAIVVVVVVCLRCGAGLQAGQM